MMTHRWRIAAAAAACAALCVGCGRGKDNKAPAKAAPETAPGDPATDAGVSPLPERTAVTSVQVRVVDPTDGPEREIYPRELAKRYGATLTDSDWFVDDTAPAPPGVRVRPGVVDLTVGYSVVSEGSTGQPAIIAVVEAQLRWTDRRNDGLEVGMRVLAERPLAKAERKDSVLDGLVAEHVENVVADAAVGMIAKERIRVGPDEEAIGALDTGDVDMRIWALAVIRERRITDAFDAAVRRLGSDRDEERDAAIGALIALKDRRAVGPLTKMADFQDYALMRVVIEAVATLGGEEAVDYLEFVATGHPDSDIVRQASDALERLQNRQRSK